MLLGDFNAQVGSSSGDDDLWLGVLGRHGVGEGKETGKRFLELCTLNQFTIINT